MNCLCLYLLIAFLCLSTSFSEQSNDNLDDLQYLYEISILQNKRIIDQKNIEIYSTPIFLNNYLKDLTYKINIQNADLQNLQLKVVRKGKIEEVKISNLVKVKRPRKTLFGFQYFISFLSIDIADLTSKQFHVPVKIKIYIPFNIEQSTENVKQIPLSLTDQRSILPLSQFVAIESLKEENFQIQVMFEWIKIDSSIKTFLFDKDNIIKTEFILEIFELISEDIESSKVIQNLKKKIIAKQNQIQQSIKLLKLNKTIKDMKVNNFKQKQLYFQTWKLSALQECQKIIYQYEKAINMYQDYGVDQLVQKYILNILYSLQDTIKIIIFKTQYIEFIVYSFIQLSFMGIFSLLLQLQQLIYWFKGSKRGITLFFIYYCVISNILEANYSFMLLIEIYIILKCKYIRTNQFPYFTKRNSRQYRAVAKFDQQIIQICGIILFILILLSWCYYTQLNHIQNISPFDLIDQLLDKYYIFFWLLCQVYNNEKLKSTFYINKTRAFFFMVIALLDNFLILIWPNFFYFLYLIKEDILVVVLIYQMNKYTNDVPLKDEKDYKDEQIQRQRIAKQQRQRNIEEQRRLESIKMQQERQRIRRQQNTSIHEQK